MSFLKQASGYIARSYGVTILRVVRNLVLMGILTQELFGQTQMALGMLALMTSLCLPGVDSLITQTCARKEAIDISSLHRFKLYVAFFWGLCCQIYAIYAFKVDHQTLQFAITVSLLGLSLPLESYSITRAIWLGESQIAPIAKRDLSAAFIALVLTVILAYWMPNDIVLLVVLPRLIEALSWQLPYRQVIKRYQVIPEKSIYLTQRSYAFHRSLLMILPSLEIRIDRVLVGALFGFKELAIFAVAKFVMEQLKTFTTAILAVLMPRLAKGDEKTARKELWHLGLPISLAVMLCAVLLCVGAITVIEWWLPAYQQSRRYIILYLAGALLSIPGALVQSFTEARKKIKVEYASRLTIAAVGLGSMMLLLPFYGVDGIVYAFILKAAAMSLVSVVTCWEYVKPDKFRLNKEI